MILTAILAAQEADAQARHRSGSTQPPVPGEQVSRLLDGALPELVAAERARVVALARVAAARCPGCPGLAALIQAIRNGDQP